MESMDYNNYFAPAPHTFGYLGFGNDATVLGHGAGSDNNGAVEVSLAAMKIKRLCDTSIVADTWRNVEHGDIFRHQRLHPLCFRLQLRRISWLRWQCLWGSAKLKLSISHRTAHLAIAERLFRERPCSRYGRWNAWARQEIK